MCLDPRPDSLFRARPAARRPTTSRAAATETCGTSTAWAPDQDGWSVAGDALDLRGWTLVTRSSRC